MKVLFNLIPTQPLGSKRHGGGKYGEAILRYIVSHKYEVICVFNSRKWLNPDVEKLLFYNNVPLYDIQECSIPDIIDKCGITTYYTPIVNKKTIGQWKCRMVGTIHGLRSLEMPIDSMFCKYKGLKPIAKYLVLKYFGSYYRMRESRFLRDTLNLKNFNPITVSYHSSSSLKCFFPESKDKVIPVFYSPSTSLSDNETQKKYDEKYMFIVSASEPHKNALRAIIALDKLFSMGYLADVKVKITGAFSSKDFHYKFENIERFEFLGFVDEYELNCLFHDAYCLLYPSLNEGFGYPPLEAMKHGTPVVASPFTSITEVCSNAALYFNPYSVEEIMSRLLLITDDLIYSLYSQRAKDRYAIVKEKQDDDLKKLVEYIYDV